MFIVKDKDEAHSSQIKSLKQDIISLSNRSREFKEHAEKLQSKIKQIESKHAADIEKV